jgi:hypothetical protein
MVIYKLPELDPNLVVKIPDLDPAKGSGSATMPTETASTVTSFCLPVRLLRKKAYLGERKSNRRRRRLAEFCS